MNARNILALNSGSSSIKIGWHRVDAAGSQQLSSQTLALADAGTCFAKLFADTHQAVPDVIGHRIVHGGPKLQQHCLIDGAVMQQLDAAKAFAPLHVPTALSLIHMAQAQFPGVPQVACFDTQFHAGLPDVARVLPISRALQDQGIQRYGFHGLSCESILRQLGPTVPQRLIVAHLGNGASITAIKDGRSIDTSMGMTPSGGAMMGTRSGDLDPGVLLYLMREQQFDVGMLAELIDHRCGLLGVSGLASDMRELQAASGSNTDARLAIEMFCMSVRKQIGAMIAVLGGLDLLVFTGGIGEHHANIRAAICEGLSWVGHFGVQVLPSQEEEQIARHAWALVSQQVT